MISEARYYVIEARTADKAVEFFKQHNSLELVVTDIQIIWPTRKTRVIEIILI